MVRSLRYARQQYNKKSLLLIMSLRTPSSSMFRCSDKITKLILIYSVFYKITVHCTKKFTKILEHRHGRAFFVLPLFPRIQTLSKAATDRSGVKKISPVKQGFSVAIYLLSKSLLNFLQSLSQRLPTAVWDIPYLSATSLSLFSS